MVITAVERRRATQHDVENHSNAPHVTRFSVLSREDLRGDVVRSSVHLSHLLAVISAEVVTSAEIDHLNGATFFDVNENILRFQITMGNLLAVAIRNGLQDLLEDLGRLCLLKILLINDHVEEFGAFTKLRHEEQCRLVLVDLEEPHNVRMGQVLEDVDFILETRLLVIAEGELVNDFDGELVARLLVSNPLYRSEGARTEQCLVHVVLGFEDVQIFVHLHKVGVLNDHVILVFVDFVLCDWSEDLSAKRDWLVN